jgi:hypothetical protein
MDGWNCGLVFSVLGMAVLATPNLRRFNVKKQGIISAYLFFEDSALVLLLSQCCLLLSLQPPSKLRPDIEEP